MGDVILKTYEEVNSQIKDLLDAVKIPFRFLLVQNGYRLEILRSISGKLRTVFTIERSNPHDVIKTLRLLLENLQPQPQFA
jgi:hypothetical protein